MSRSSSMTGGQVDADHVAGPHRSAERRPAPQDGRQRTWTATCAPSPARCRAPARPARSNGPRRTPVRSSRAAPAPAPRSACATSPVVRGVHARTTPMTTASDFRHHLDPLAKAGGSWSSSRPTCAASWTSSSVGPQERIRDQGAGLLRALLREAEHRSEDRSASRSAGSESTAVAAIPPSTACPTSMPRTSPSLSATVQAPRPRRTSLTSDNVQGIGFGASHRTGPLGLD
jgi:hypothetical protein